MEQKVEFNLNKNIIKLSESFLTVFLFEKRQKMKSLLTILLVSCSINSISIAQEKLVIDQNDSMRIEVKYIAEINSEFDDYAPVITADGEQLFFTSRRPYTDKEISKNKQGKENIYSAEYDSDSKKWSKPKPLNETINITGRHNSILAISNDGQRMLKYQDDQYGNGDILESFLKGESWSDPKSISTIINSDEHESSASIAPNGKTIYFVSTRKGGQGGRDIWMSTKNENGKWSEPKNLGKTVNTSQDEEAVFIHPDGKTLFFSSKGHNSTGGYDIFKTVNNNGRWSTPINLGSPINTPDDDLFFVLAANGKTGFYASNRGAQTKNIYRIDFIELERPQEEVKSSSPNLTILKGVITDKETGKPIEAVIEVTDNTKNEIVARYNSNSSTGKYLLSLPSGTNYGVNIQAEGYLFESFSFDLADTASYQEYIKDVALNKLKAGTKVVLKNIFFDYDKATLRNESIAELTRLVRIMEEYPKLKIEIGGHTDSRGSDEYNNRLSKDRAGSVVNYLIEKGIDTNRLTFKGYGKSQPIATNDTEEGRQENRRVEFKIISND